MNINKDDVSALHKRIVDNANSEMYNEYQKLKQETKDRWSMFIYGHTGYQIKLKSLEDIVTGEHAKIIERRVNQKYDGLITKIKDLQWLWENKP